MYNCNQTPVLKVSHVIFIFIFFSFIKNKIFGIYLITLPLRGKMFTTLDLKKQNKKKHKKNQQQQKKNTNTLNRGLASSLF